MIKKIITVACLIGLFGGLSSCYSIKQSQTQYHISTEKLTESTKTGKACAYGFVFGPFGDFTMEAARKNGKITQINSVENSHSNFLGFYSFYKICTIVVGN